MCCNCTITSKYTLLPLHCSVDEDFVMMKECSLGLKFLFD